MRNMLPNAWELLRRLLPRYSYVEDRSGRALRIVGHRGRSSISVAGSESPMVIVDGARLSSLELLQNMPPDAIDRIEIQGGSRGTNTAGHERDGRRDLHSYAIGFVVNAH